MSTILYLYLCFVLRLDVWICFISTFPPGGNIREGATAGQVTNVTNVSKQNIKVLQWLINKTPI